MSTMPHWHGRLGTIQQPLGSEPSAPPVVLLPYVVCVAGFDPAVSCFQGSRGSRPREWCSSWWLTAFADIGRAGQLAIVGRLTAGSSLNGAMVSRVM